MIISRKKFEAELQMAAMKREQEMWKERRYEEDQMHFRRRLDNLEERVFALEEKLNLKRPSNYTCNPSE